MSHVSQFAEFASKDDNARLIEQERLILAATELVEELMQRQGVSKAAMAERLGKSRASVTQLLNGSRNMTLRSLADLVFCLGNRVDVESRSIHCDSLESTVRTFYSHKAQGRPFVVTRRCRGEKEWLEPSRRVPGDGPVVKQVA